MKLMRKRYPLQYQVDPLNDKVYLEVQQRHFYKKSGHYPDESYYHQQIHTLALQCSLRKYLFFSLTVLSSLAVQRIPIYCPLDVSIANIVLRL